LTGRRAAASRFLATVAERPLVCDAATGTRLIARGLDLRVDDPALWNLTHPEDVLELHRRDVAAGSRVLVANTFGANRWWLGNLGHAGAIESINRRAVELARLAAGPDGFVLGSLGPTTARRTGTAAEQAAILAAAGVDALCFETFRAGEIEAVLMELDAKGALPIPLIVSLWEWPEPPEEIALALIELGAAILGMNCRPGIEAALDFAERMDGLTDCPLFVKPAAGDPGHPDGTPAAFAAAVPRLLEHNVRILGGCCGTDERHVGALAGALDADRGMPAV
jgi:5-methyltetrahydrofolate--homocysteine methyltransferase